MPLPTQTERQRERRAILKECGYRRLDITLDRHLLKRLQPYIEPYGGNELPGSALVKWLDAWTKAQLVKKD